MSELTRIVHQLKYERKRTEGELHQINDALTALGSTTPKRVLSADARKRISRAQRLRWAKVRRAEKTTKILEMKRPVRRAA